MIDTAPAKPADWTPKSLPPSLKQGLRALAVAGSEFEPFVEWIVSKRVIEQLVTMGLAEQGESSRPSVGLVGYRLTVLGRQCVAILWRHAPEQRLVQVMR